MKSNLDRRRWITVSAAGAMAIPHVWGQTVLGQSTDQTLRVCIAGAGGRGGEHIRGMHKDPRTRIAAVVDTDDAAANRRADQIAKLQGTRPAVYRDVRDPLDDDSIDIVTIATPNHWHALMAIWAMRAGKHVYVEKPISHNVDEGRALVATAAATGRVFQTGTQCRSSRAVRDAVAAVAAGAIGDCRLARGLCYKRRRSIGPLGRYPVPENIDYALWSGPAPITDPPLTRPRFHYDWHWQRHYGNGDLGNQGPHQTDIARWGLGLDRHPASILSYGGRLGYDAETGNPDFVDAGDTANTEVSIYDYGDKQIVFETRGLDVTDSAGDEVDAFFGKQPGNKIGVIFYGEDGYIVQTEFWQAKQFDRNWNLVRTWDCDNIGDAHFSNFLDAVVAGDPTMVHADAMTGHLSAGMSHLGNVSYYLGESNRVPVAEIRSALDSLPRTQFADNHTATLAATVAHLRINGVDLDRTPMSLGPLLTFDPAAERFPDNEAANAKLTREYQPGFEVEMPTV